MFVLSHKKTAFNHFLMLYDGSRVDDFKLDLIKSPPAITEKFSSYLATKIDLLIIKFIMTLEWSGGAVNLINNVMRNARYLYR